MKAIVTLVIENMKKGVQKQVGIDILGRLSTDVHSRHKCILIEGKTIKDIQKIALNSITSIINPVRISRIEVIED